MSSLGSQQTSWKPSHTLILCVYSYSAFATSRAPLLPVASLSYTNTTVRLRKGSRILGTIISPPVIVMALNPWDLATAISFSPAQIRVILFSGVIRQSSNGMIAPETPFILDFTFGLPPGVYVRTSHNCPYIETGKANELSIPVGVARCNSSATVLLMPNLLH